ncbi:MAG TPA: hypothetical protein VK638_58575, partial [Edaphobacter sp.]|nr:hypothetical protein [Edaphobacter sp.]
MSDCFAAMVSLALAFIAASIPAGPGLILERFRRGYSDNAVLSIRRLIASRSNASGERLDKTASSRGLTRDREEPAWFELLTRWDL